MGSRKSIIIKSRKETVKKRVKSKKEVSKNCLKNLLRSASMNTYWLQNTEQGSSFKKGKNFKKIKSRKGLG
jgi:hypothetical protein